MNARTGLRRHWAAGRRFRPDRRRNPEQPVRMEKVVWHSKL